MLPGFARFAAFASPAWLTNFTRRGAPWPDIQLAAYAGPAYTMPSDVRLRQPGGTDLTLRQVPWRGEPFKAPPYYGYRGIWWLPANDALGLMLDFTHIKAKAMLNEDVDQEGLRDGAALGPRGPISDTFRRLEFTHGYNLLTLNALYRSRPSARVQPYLGVGAGIAVPHVEMRRADLPARTRTFEYQVTGPAFQVLAGVQWRVLGRLSLFAEYKLSCSINTGRLVGGGTLAADLCSHQLLAGPALHLRPFAAPAP